MGERGEDGAQGDAPRLRPLKPEDDRDIQAGRYGRVGAAAILVNGEGQVLLQLRDDIPTIRYPGYWSMPGGVLESGETPEEAIRRELLEEISYAAHEVERYGRILDAYRNLIHIFLVRVNVPFEELVLGEGRAISYFGQEELAGLPITPHALEVLAYYFSEAGRV